jgi:hypothetical protein
MTTVFDQIRMLPREVPRDQFHEAIVKALTSGEATTRQVMPLFEMPGIGFHRALFTLTMFLAEYRIQGRQTFVIPVEMQEALSRTSLEDVGFDDLKLPYRCLYISMPDCEAEIWGGDTTKWHKVGGAFVRFVPAGQCIEETEGKEVCQEGMINVYLWGMENDLSHGPGDDASMWFTFDLAELRGTDLESYLTMMLNDPRRDASLSEVTDLGRKMGLSTAFPRGAMRDKAMHGIMHSMRVVFNALLYMDCSEADVSLDPAVGAAQAERKDVETRLGRMKNPNKSRARKLRKQLDNLPLDVVSWVGRSVRIKGTEPSSTGTGSPQRKHWVRGHWWPRRDTIQSRLASARAAHNEALGAYEKAQGQLACLPDTSPDIPSLVPILTGLRRASTTRTTDLREITEALSAKRRWVKPYKKGSKGSLPNSHTYVLGETQESET